METKLPFKLFTSESKHRNEVFQPHYLIHRVSLSIVIIFLVSLGMAFLNLVTEI